MRSRLSAAVRDFSSFRSLPCSSLPGTTSTSASGGGEREADDDSADAQAVAAAVEDATRSIRSASCSK